MTAQNIPSDPEQSSHLPVLIEEVLDGLAPETGAMLIDGTLGGGGHTEKLLQATQPEGRILGLDADPAAIRRVGHRLAEAIGSERLITEQANFVDIQQVAIAKGFDQVDGILLDLGISSFQLETAARGFSIQQAGPLDMRFDPRDGESAMDIINQWPEADIADVLYRYGEERRSRQIARRIVQQRPIETTDHLAKVVEAAVGGRRGKRIHPATKTFQALRIAVNDELGRLERTLPQCLALLKPGGRVAVISFHSLEDRIVKQWMQQEARDFIPDPRHPYGGVEATPTLRTLTRRPVTAGQEEVENNPRSRSAKLRIAEKI